MSKTTVYVAIDAFNYFYKYKISCPHFLSGFYQQIVRMLRMKIVPVYVFDGAPPEEKKAELKLRRERRETAADKITVLKSELASMTELTDLQRSNIEAEIKRLEQNTIRVTKADINQVKLLLDMMNVPYVEAMGEADYLCSKLVRENVVDACMSDDTDLLMSGCHRVIKYLNNIIVEFDLYTIIYKMGLTYDQFRMFCIILGCGYHVEHPTLNDYQIRQAHAALRGDITRLYSFLKSSSLKFEDIPKYIAVYDTLYTAETSVLTKTTIDTEINTSTLLEFFASLDITDNTKVEKEITCVNSLIRSGAFTTVSHYPPKVAYDRPSKPMHKPSSRSPKSHKLFSSATSFGEPKATSNIHDCATNPHYSSYVYMYAPPTMLMAPISTPTEFHPKVPTEPKPHGYSQSYRRRKLTTQKSSISQHVPPFSPIHPVTVKDAIQPIDPQPLN
jgi:hypothetical protein